MDARLRKAIRRNGVCRGFRWRVDPKPPPIAVANVEGEEWKQIEGDVSMSVSNMGRLSKRGTLFHCPDKIPLSRSASGYYTCNIAGAFRGVHQLVAEAFLGPSHDDEVVHHDDGDVTNNRADNLSFRSTKRHNKKRKRAHEEEEGAQS